MEPNLFHRNYTIFSVERKEKTPKSQRKTKFFTERTFLQKLPFFRQKTSFGFSFSPKKKQGLSPAKILFCACKTAAPFIITSFANIQHMIFPVFLRKITPLFFQMEIIFPFCVNLFAAAITKYFISDPHFFQNGFVCFHAASPFVLSQFSFLLHFNMAIDIFL